MLEPQTLDCLKRHYRFADWEDRNRMPESLFVHGWFMSGQLLPGWQLHREETIQIAGQRACLRSFWKGTEMSGERLLRLDAYPCSSRAKAHEWLLAMLGGFQAPLADERETPAGPGDVAFFRPGCEVVLFARANLVFLLARVGRDAVPVLLPAADLDRDVTTKPPVPARATLAAADWEVSALRSRTASGEGASIPLMVRRTSPGPTCYKFYARSGEVRESRHELVYRPGKSGGGRVWVYALAGGQPASCRILDLGGGTGAGASES